MKRNLVTVQIPALVTLIPQHMAYAGDDKWTFLVSTSEIVSSFAFAPNNPSTFYAGARFVFKTTEGSHKRRKTCKI
jgi:hypothetical protein